jgi:cytochrome c-type biogenesis protein
VQREILERNPAADLRVFAVWVPFLGGTKEAADVSRRVLPDTRVALVRSLPWVGLGVGVLLVLIGGLALSGRHIATSVPQRLASRAGREAGASGMRGYAAFGFAYGAASLGCTLPLFLALMGTAAATSGRGSALIAFVLYGAGMASVLGVLTVTAGVVSFGILGRARGLVRVVASLGAALLLLSGGYVVYYWLTAGRLLLG